MCQIVVDTMIFLYSDSAYISALISLAVIHYDDINVTLLHTFQFFFIIQILFKKRSLTLYKLYRASY